MDDLIFVSKVSIPSFNFLACLEVGEKFVWRFHGLYQRFHGLCAFQVTTMSNLNPNCFELLSVELS